MFLIIEKRESEETKFINIRNIKPKIRGGTSFKLGLFDPEGEILEKMLIGLRIYFD
ncbi:hypothetical protein KKE45_03480 [Patescibacteria group bacterium]|nr:hypothetical protein [Patescibacteria group bacterium]